MSMDDTVAPNFSVPNNVLALLFIASHSSTLNEALECLIETAKSSDGRLYLASKGVLLPVLELCRSASQLSGQDLLLSIKLLRNLCAGEITNQNLFIEQNGVEILSTIISSMALTSGLDNGILRMLLQVLGNVSLASEQHRLVVWRHFFPLGFLDIARVQSNETCDPLCMIIYTCSEGSSERSVDLLSDKGMDIITEIIRTVTVAGFREDWVKLLLSRICLEESYFWTFFSKLSPVAEAENSDDHVSQINHFGAQQAFLLRILSEILNEWIGDIVVPNEFSSCIFQILRNAVGVVDFNTRGKSSLPTGSGDIDVIGYTLSILRDISASGGPKVANQDEKGDAVDTLVSAGLIKFLITLLRDLEPPAIIRKAMIHNEAKDGTTSQPFKYCPYRGFRRDVVAIIGNFSYRKKLVQDEIRELDGILLLLQQCVTDEDNPFLREWGIWSMRNVLEGNTENQQLVANLELQGSVEVPEIAGLGLRVEVDPKTRRPKLVNAS
ncbi:UNVERIFIED_CONTAM: Ataxin-10 [Sesamum angustifolium]|uniref:Ataxin-10 n=1 Tax=Sesamum angustifolium TaxID=2727405 RepID=A0AAW2QA69_9LAMI